MQNKTVPPFQSLGFDAALIRLLACPACGLDLRLESAGLACASLVCAGCGRAYPVVDGIPVLIAERADAAIAPRGLRN
jgi:uncharacterized protein YbaR (Trm112 family)